MHEIRHTLVAAVLGGACGLAAGQTTPTYDELVYGVAGLDSGGTIQLHLDIYRPPTATGPTPVALWIHGGGWQGGSHNGVGFLAPLLQRGISVASVEYRLSGQAIFPAQIHDVKGAVRFLKANAQTFGLDPLRIAAAGSSAGGHLAALLGTSGGVAAAEGTTGGNLGRSSRILAVADFYGPTDLLNMQLDVTDPPGSGIDHDASTSPESKLIGFDGPGEGIGVLRANQFNPAAPYPQLMQLVTLASPLTHVSGDDPAFFIAHGTDDRSVPIAQSRRLIAALESAGVESSFTGVEGAGHGDLGSATNAAAVNFLERELRRPFGDANRDDTVDISDLAVLATNWQRPGGWAQGDFDSNGMIDIRDLSLLATNWQVGGIDEMLSQMGLPASAVPEPSASVLAMLGVAALARRVRPVANYADDADGW